MKTPTIQEKMREAERKAWLSLAGYKFLMFGYWAAIWVHLKKLEGKKRESPFGCLVAAARERLTYLK